MSEFGVSELEWGTELPLFSLWKSYPWHAPPLKHSYDKIIFTSFEPIGRNCWRQQRGCLWGCSGRIPERISLAHCSSQDSTQPCLAVSTAESSPSQNVLQAGSNPLREHFQLLRRAGADQLRCLAVQIFLQYSREYDLQRSARDHQGDRIKNFVF